MSYRKVPRELSTSEGVTKADIHIAEIELAKLEREVKLSRFPGQVRQLKRIRRIGNLVIECWHRFGLSGVSVAKTSAGMAEEARVQAEVKYNIQLLYYDYWSDKDNNGIAEKQLYAYGLSPGKSIVPVTVDNKETTFRVFSVSDPAISALYCNQVAQCVYTVGGITMGLLQYDEAAETGPSFGIEWYHNVRVINFEGGADFAYRAKMASSTVCAALSSDLLTLYLVVYSGAATFYEVHTLVAGEWVISDSAVLDNTIGAYTRIGTLSVTRDGEVGTWKTVSGGSHDHTSVDSTTDSGSCGASSGYAYLEQFYHSDEEYYTYDLSTKSFVVTSKLTQGIGISPVLFDYGVYKGEYEGGPGATSYAFYDTVCEKSCGVGWGACCYNSSQYTIRVANTNNSPGIDTYLYSVSGDASYIGEWNNALQTFSNRTQEHNWAISYNGVNCNYIKTMTQDYKDGTFRGTVVAGRCVATIDTYKSYNQVDYYTAPSSTGVCNDYIAGCSGAILTPTAPAAAPSPVEVDTLDLRNPLEVSDIYEVTDGFCSIHQDVGMCFFGAKYSMAAGEDHVWHVFCKTGQSEVAVDITDQLTTKLAALTDAAEADLIMANLQTIVFITDAVAETTDETTEV